MQSQPRAPQIVNFLEQLRESLADATFVKLTLGTYRGRDAELRNAFVRRIQLRGREHLSFTYRHARRDITKNMPVEEGVQQVSDLIGTEFLSAHLCTTRFTAELQFRSGRGVRLIHGPAAHAEPPTPNHDRARVRPLPAMSVRWLSELGVTTPDGQVRKGMEAKHRQINRFVEVLAPLLAQIDAPDPASPLRVIDMGCGKGYLTFALRDHLESVRGPGCEVRGIEQRPELVELTNRVATSTGSTGLTFHEGAIGAHDPGRFDVLVALHACDTATDDALAEGIAAGARLLVVAPCCQKEIRPQLRPPEVLADALRHGIFLERQAEFVTDALRAALLEWAGYETRVFEFIDTEHTAKNLMITAIRRHPPGDPGRLARARALAAFYGIETHQLAAHLGILLKDSPPQ